MTDTVVSDAVVVPLDEGIGSVSDTDEGMDSAAGLAALATHIYGSYVREGDLPFNNVDTTNEQVDVGAGRAFVTVSSTTLQSDRTNAVAPTYDTTLASDVPLCVILPTAEENLGLGTDTGNDLWLAVDTDGSTTTPAAGVYIRHGSGLSAPSDPSVKLGTVDTSSGATTRANDLATPKVAALNIASGGSIQDGGTDAISFDGSQVATFANGIVYADATKSANYTTSGDEVIYADVSGSALTITLESGLSSGREVAVLDHTGSASTNNITIDTAGAANIEGSTSITISSDHGSRVLSFDGTNWTVAAATPASGGSDTRTDVSDSGATAVSDTTDIDFVTVLTATADGDGTATVDVSLGNGVENNAGTLRVNPAGIAGDGLKETSATALGVEPADFAGTHLSDDGADNLTVDDDFVENTGDQMSGDLFIQDANGLVVGNTSQVTLEGGTPESQVTGTGTFDSAQAIARYSDGIYPAFLMLAKSRAASIGGSGALYDDDHVASIAAIGDDGTDMTNNPGAIEFFVDGAVSTDTVPGRVEISTTPTGGGAPDSGLVIDSNQDVGLPNGDLTSNDTNGAIEVDEEASLADAGKTQLSRDAAAHGYAFIEDVTNDEACLVYLGGGANTVEIIHDSGSGNNFTTTEDNDTTTNIYWDATNSRYEINNETGAAATYAVEVLKA